MVEKEINNNFYNVSFYIVNFTHVITALRILYHEMLYQIRYTFVS